MTWLCGVRAECVCHHNRTRSCNGYDHPETNRLLGIYIDRRSTCVEGDHGCPTVGNKY